MPASSTDSLLHIEESLRSSLHRGSEDEASALRKRLVSSSKRILLEKVEFEPAVNSASQQFDQLRAKYNPLNPSGSHLLTNGSTDTMSGSHDEPTDGLPAPKVVLYPAHKITLEWNGMKRVGAGLHNLGNTCFLNSTLQCLTYTPPLVNYLVSKEHSNCCKQVGFCIVCELQRHIQRCHDNSGQAIKPHSILQKIKLIAKHMHWGRQEDAHEFLRYLVDAMQKVCLNGYTKLDRYSKETTVVNQIFGGFLQSQVTCLRCKAKSNTYDPVMDICLDVKNVPSVQKAFEKFVQPEMLDHDNAYNCIKCKQKVPAKKRFSLHKPPNTLTIQLKRYSVMGGKVSRHIAFPEKLDVRPYMSNKQGEPVLYQLYAVLVHMGMSTSSGHYFCYIRAPNQTWYCMNDSAVQQTSINRVLNSEAYLLFFVRMKSSSSISQPKQAPFIGPKLPNQVANGQFKNGFLSMPSNEFGQALSRKNISSPQSKVTKPSAALGRPDSLQLTSNSPSKALATQRDKVSFEFRSNKEVGVSKEATKPRIVMHIKNGKVVHSSVGDKKDAVAAAAKVASSDKPTKLVPYDSNDESDTDTVKPNSAPAQTSVTSQKSVGTDGKGKTDKNQNGSVKASSSFEPSLDSSLNTTVNVPGAYGPLTKENVSKELIQKKLTVVACAEPVQRVNATTRWNVMMDQDAALKSPSIASEASSSHSTTDWQVTSSTDKLPCIVPEAQHVGWTVTPNTSSVQAAGMSTCDATSTPVKMSSTDSDEVKSCSVAKSDKGSSVAPDVNGHQDPRITSSDSELSSSTKSNGTVPNPRKLFQDDSQKDLSTKACLEEKAGEADCTESSTSVMFSPSSPSASGDACNSAPLVNGYSSGKKKHKKHKKHKHKSREDDTAHSDGSHHRRDHGKQHKKKKKKHHHREDERPLLDSSTDSGTASSSTGANTSSDLLWVEKTKETMEHSSSLNKSSHVSVPVQSWDERRPSDHQRRPAWDGSRSDRKNVVEELIKTSSSRGFGSQVSSWDGSASHLNQDVKRDKQNERKRRWEDEYEEDLDRGKTKKVKERVERGGGGSQHSFQKLQDQRNADEHRRRIGQNGHNTHLHSHHSNSYHRDNHSSHRYSHGSCKKHSR